MRVTTSTTFLALSSAIASTFLAATANAQDCPCYSEDDFDSVTVTQYAEWIGLSSLSGKDSNGGNYYWDTWTQIKQGVDILTCENSQTGANIVVSPDEYAECEDILREVADDQGFYRESPECPCFDTQDLEALKFTHCIIPDANSIYAIDLSQQGGNQNHVLAGTHEGSNSCQRNQLSSVHGMDDFAKQDCLDVLFAFCSADPNIQVVDQL